MLPATIASGNVLQTILDGGALAVSAAQRVATRAQQAAGRATASYQAAHVQFLQAVTQQYEGGHTLFGP